MVGEALHQPRGVRIALLAAEVQRSLLQMLGQRQQAAEQVVAGRAISFQCHGVVPLLQLVLMTAKKRAGDSERLLPLPFRETAAASDPSDGRGDEIARQRLPVDNARQQALDARSTQAFVHVVPVGRVGNVAGRGSAGEPPLLAEALMPGKIAVPCFDTIKEFRAREFAIEADCHAPRSCRVDRHDHDVRQRRQARPVAGNLSPKRQRVELPGVAAFVRGRRGVDGRFRRRRAGRFQAEQGEGVAERIGNVFAANRPRDDHLLATARALPGDQPAQRQVRLLRRFVADAACLLAGVVGEAAAEGETGSVVGADQLGAITGMTQALRMAGGERNRVATGRHAQTPLVHPRLVEPDPCFLQRCVEPDRRLAAPRDLDLPADEGSALIERRRRQQPENGRP